MTRPRPSPPQATDGSAICTSGPAGTALSWSEYGGPLEVAGVAADELPCRLVRRCARRRKGELQPSIVQRCGSGAWCRAARDKNDSGGKAAKVAARIRLTSCSHLGRVVCGIMQRQVTVAEKARRTRISGAPLATARSVRSHRTCSPQLHEQPMPARRELSWQGTAPRRRWNSPPRSRPANSGRRTHRNPCIPPPGRAYPADSRWRADEVQCRRADELKINGGVTIDSPIAPQV